MCGPHPRLHMCVCMSQCINRAPVALAYARNHLAYGASCSRLDQCCCRAAKKHCMQNHNLNLAKNRPPICRCGQPDQGVGCAHLQAVARVLLLQPRQQLGHQSAWPAGGGLRQQSAGALTLQQNEGALATWQSSGALALDTTAT